MDGSKGSWLWKHPGSEAAWDGLLRLAVFFVLIFYFYPLDMIPIVSRQPQRLNGLVKPPWRTALCGRLGGGGSCLPVSQTLPLFRLSFPLEWLIFLVDALICGSAGSGQDAPVIVAPSPSLLFCLMWCSVSDLDDSWVFYAALRRFSVAPPPLDGNAWPLFALCDM